MLDVTINIPGGIKGGVEQYCVAEDEGKNHHWFLQVLEIGRNLLSGPCCKILNWGGGRGEGDVLLRGIWLVKCIRMAQQL